MKKLMFGLAAFKRCVSTLGRMRIGSISYIVAVGTMVSAITPFHLHAANVTASITLFDADASAVKDAVIIFNPLFESPSAEDSDAKKPPRTAIMNQINKQFAPHVLVVNKNTEVTFPNADNVFHHVYSFSPTKQFELKLYKEFTAEPLLFEEPGIVDIGCNIHDWMLGYIVIADSPYYVKTNDDGHAALSLPAGKYNVEFWHPNAPNEMPFTNSEVNLTRDINFNLTLSTVITNEDDFDDGFGDY